jgi:hypothetical protein
MTMTTATRTVIPVPIREPAYREPTLADMLSDPIVTAVMRADKVDPTKLHAMLGRLAGELHARRRLSLFAPGAGGSRSFVFIPHGYPGNWPNEPKQ